DVKAIVGFAAAAILAYYITTLPAMNQHGGYFYMFISGALAICAMILPGISGAFILVLLGSYGTILGALSAFDFKSIGVFILDRIVRILCIARLHKYLFTHYKNLTIASRTGFILE